MTTFQVWTDGGSRGNPGPSAWGYIIKSGSLEYARGGYMGIASNNEAEYMAVVHALQHAMSLRPHTGEIVVYSDSKLVVGQLSLGWRVKASNLIPLHIMARDFDRMMGCPVRYVHIPREQNKGADSIVNRVLDEQEAELNGSNDDC